MIIGNWFLAKSFPHYRDSESVLIFASGVSNSQNTDKLLFQREEGLLRKVILEHPDKHFVYFSTCSILDPSLWGSAYVIHKKRMEQIIAESCDTFSIFRIANPIGITENPHTLLNYLSQKIRNGDHFIVWKNARRNLIDIDHLVLIASYIIDHELHSNMILNIASPIDFSILEIVKTLEYTLGVSGKYSVEPLGWVPMISLEGVEWIINELNLKFDKNYLKDIVEKYYL